MFFSSDSKNDLVYWVFRYYHLSPVHLFMPQSFPQDSICQLHLTMVPTLRKAAAVSTMHEAKGPPTPLFAGTGRAEHTRAVSNPGWVGDDFQEMSAIPCLLAGRTHISV